jgi:hypothetical protein
MRTGSTSTSTIMITGIRGNRRGGPVKASQEVQTVVNKVEVWAGIEGESRWVGCCRGMLLLGWQGQYIYGVYAVFLAGKSPNIRSYTLYIYSSGQPYLKSVPLLSVPCMRRKLSSQQKDAPYIDQGRPHRTLVHLVPTRICITMHVDGVYVLVFMNVYWPTDTL